MKLKRFLALVLALCMILPYGLQVRAEEAGEESSASEILEFEKLNNVSVELAKVEAAAAARDMAIERQMVDANGMVRVFIVMEGKAVLETNAAARLNPQSQAQREALENSQMAVVARIEENVLEGADPKVLYHYTWLTNAVAAEIPYSAIGEIRKVPGVRQVIVEPVYEICANAGTNTISDGVMVGRENTWADGYTGKGIKIAVLDTGLDIDHQNFGPLSEDKLTGDSATAESISAVLENLNAFSRYSGLTIDDVYHSSKVVFGYNYSDDSLDITHGNDTQGDHGTHVAGIAAANKVDVSGVVGVAPDAQLFIMKVFGARRAGAAIDIIAALEDALLLGVDVVNMSLGSNAGFTSSADEFIDSVYARVAETNTVLSVSAGNNYTAGYYNMWGTNANTTSNPDNAVIGEPGAYNNVMSVASVENWKIQRLYVDVAGYEMAYVETSASYGLPAVTTLTDTYEVVAVPGYGAPEDFEGLDLTGKVALVQRGVESFVSKCQNSEAAGAVACMVYNNTSGEFYMDLTDCKAAIPCISITQADGEYLLARMEENGTAAVSFPTTPASIPSLTAYQMSEFSSWGVAPDMSLEPDITAPGGNIYSTIDNGMYGLMSGTSMAAPNISGLTALVMQYAKANFPGDTDYRDLVQNLLISTAGPLACGEDGLYYSPRSQGSGLANAYNAVHSQAYLTVDGVDTPKAELGDDPGKNGNYSFTFRVKNFGTDRLFYDLDTVVQSEGYKEDPAHEGVYFMSSTPVSLSASSWESSAAMVLTHDVNGTSLVDSADAYSIYMAATGKAGDHWTGEAFRYDVNTDDAVTTDDVQEMLNALVGLDYTGDVEDTVLQVEAGRSADVTVSVALSDSARAYLDTYYPNGGYVEGFTFLTARNEGGVDLSLPYMAFYGSWDAAPILDNGNYWDLLNAGEEEVLGNQYWNVLFSNFYGYESYVYPGMNVYLEDEAFDMAHIAISPNSDGYFDTVDDIYTSLLRNAANLTYRYTNTETGEVYYDQTVLNVNKSVFNPSYEQIIPNVYTWYEGEIPLWDWKKPDGTQLDNNTRLLLEIVAQGAYEGATPETWSAPIYVDLEGPELLQAEKVVGEDGTTLLNLSFRDNHCIAAAALMNSNGSEIHEIQGLEDPAADENGYRNYTATFDITGMTGKLMIVLGDYAMNESHFGMNIAGEGMDYGALVGYQYNFDDEINGWVSFDPDVDCNEVQITMDDMDFACAEYVGGFVFAETETGALYGFRYSDMLLDTFDLETCYIAQLENVYQDLAYNYADGKLYGLYVYSDGGEDYAVVYEINIHGEQVDPETEETVDAWEEIWRYQRGGLYGLGMTCDDNGEFYIIGVVKDKTELWVSYERDDFEGKFFKKLMNIDVPTDYLQSMTWDHNTETIYWAQFYANSVLSLESALYQIDVNAKTCTRMGTLSGETCALFAPLSKETAAKPEHQNIPVMDTSIVAVPTLRDGVITMNVGAAQTLLYDMVPWYTDYKQVIWSTSDESVATVDQNGKVTAVGIGSATVTVANAADKTKYTSCTVQVSALDLELNGVVSSMEAGVGNTSGCSFYQYRMDAGLPTMTTGNAITAREDLNYGLSIATSVYGRGYIWVCEYGNTGIIYQVDPATGEVVDVLEPIDGDMLFGMTYSEELDTFTGIMNMYLFVDLELTHEESAKIHDYYDPELNRYNYHRLDLLPYLREAGGEFVTGETGQGASSEVVMCGITTLAEDYTYVDTGKDYLGRDAGGSVNYTATQTLVVLDNVGRLWYIDEICGLTKNVTMGGYSTEYTSQDGATKIQFYTGDERKGLMELDNEDGTYNVFYIREIEKTPLTDLFLADLMPRITYHFSDIEFGGYTSDGTPIFAMSLYDYWNNGTTNELYLYIPEMTLYDEDLGESVKVGNEKFYYLGTTGQYNIIASIHSFKILSGLED